MGQQDGQPKRTIDLPKLKLKSDPVCTEALGEVFVSPLTLGQLSTLLGTDRGADMSTLGRCAILATTRLGNDAELPPITADDFEKLTSADVQALVKAVSKRNGWTVAGDATPAALGDAIRTYAERLIRPTIDAVSRIQQDLKGPLDQLKGTFSVPTLKALTDQIASGERLDKILREASWARMLGDEMRGRRLLETGIQSSLAAELSRTSIGEPEFQYRQIEMPELDIENAPAGRAARAGEAAVEKLEVLLELGRSTLQTMSEMNALGARLSVESLAAQEAARKATLTNQEIGNRNIRIAMVALIISTALSIVSVGLTAYYRTEDDERQRKSDAMEQQQLDSIESQVKALERLANRPNSPPLASESQAASRPVAPAPPSRAGDRAVDSKNKPGGDAGAESGRQSPKRH